MDQHGAVIYQFPVTAKLPTVEALGSGATEDTDAQPTMLAGVEKSQSGGRAYLVAGRQNFTEEDFKNPAVAPKIARFLIAEIERLDDDCGTLKGIAAKYNDLRVETAALKEASKKSGLIDVLSIISLAVGSAGLGAAPGYLAIANATSFGWAIIVGSGVLVITGLISPVVSFISRAKK